MAEAFTGRSHRLRQAALDAESLALIGNGGIGNGGIDNSPGRTQPSETRFLPLFLLTKPRIFPKNRVSHPHAQVDNTFAIFL